MNEIALSVDYKKNALNTLKILAALQVAYLHIITHLNVTVPKEITGVINVFMGVPIFFILSGFLIWNSVDKFSNFKEYAAKRVVRIFPELWVGIAIEVILLLITFKGKYNYFNFFAFIFGQSTVFQFYTPDFLRTWGCGTPNGTLWTMGVTIQFYFLVWFINKTLRNKKHIWWIFAVAISILIKAVSPVIVSFLPGIAGKLYGQTIFPYLWMFIFGAFLANYQQQIIPFLKKTWWFFFALSFVFSYYKFDIGFEQYGVFTYLLRVGGLIGLCYNLPKLNIKFDISYGLFIYHMLVVNMMIEFGFIGRYYHLLVALFISILLAIGSTLFGRIVQRNIKR